MHEYQGLGGLRLDSSLLDFDFHGSPFICGARPAYKLLVLRAPCPRSDWHSPIRALLVGKSRGSRQTVARTALRYIHTPRVSGSQMYLWIWSCSWTFSPSSKIHAASCRGSIAPKTGENKTGCRSAMA